tara:strand:+ start:223 stop:1359 length:1137 start_codon:yes stop_codon:yes gene_type:complete
MTRRDNGDFYVFKRGNSWTARVRLPADPTTGKRSRKSFSAPTKKEAVAKARAFQKILEQGISTETRELPLSVYMPTWVDGHVLSEGLGESSRMSYQQMVKKILACIGNYQIKNVTPLVLDKLLLIDESVTQITVRRYTLLKSMFADLVLRGELESSPFNRHKTPKKPPIKEARHMETDEIVELLAAVDGSSIENLTKFLLGTGVRIGEALGLRWADIDLDGPIPIVSIRRSLRTNEGKAVFTDLKTKNSRRSIELSQALVDVLNAQKLTLDAMSIVREGWQDSGLVFPSSVGGPQDVRNIRKVWDKKLKGTSLTDVTFHTCRHSHASLSLMKGESIFTISRRLGHSDAALTMNLYSHLMRDQQSIAATAMDEFLVKSV